MGSTSGRVGRDGGELRFAGFGNRRESVADDSRGNRDDADRDGDDPLPSLRQSLARAERLPLPK